MKSIDIIKKDIEIYLEDSYHDRDVIKHPIFGVEDKDIFLLKINIPELLLIYDLSENDFKTINIPLYPNFGKISEFIKKIKLFEKKIRHIIKKNNPKLKFTSSIHDKEGEKRYFRCKFYNDLVKQNSNLQHIDLSEFKKDGSIKGSVKVPFVWVHDGKFGVYFLMSIIRYNTNKNIYIDSDDEEINKNIIQTNIIQTNIIPPLSKKRPPIQNNQLQNSNNTVPGSKNSGPFRPSSSELLMMKERLNKTKNTH